MLLTLFKKELTELWREDRVKWLILIIIPLLATSVVTSFRYSRQLKREHAAAMLADKQVWDNQPEKNPHAAAHFGLYLFKPVHPLSIFEPGVDRYIGSINFIEAHQRNSEQYSSIGDGSDVARLGFLSPSFVLQYLLPLLIIIAGFNGISREKENGNLAVLFSQGCTSNGLFWGKWLAVYALVQLIIIPVFLCVFVVLLLVKAESYNYMAAFLILCTYLLYYAIITNIVLFISSKAAQSGTAFLYCILFWITTSMLLPRLAGSIAGQASPLLTKEQIIEKVKAYNARLGGNIHDRGGPAYKHLVDSLLKKYQVDSVQQLPVNMAGIRLDAGEQSDTWNYERIREQQLQRLKKQDRIITTAGFISPLIPSQQISMAAANTDIFSHQHFTDAGEQYRRQYVNMMNRYIAYESGLQEGFTSFKMSRELWQRVPPFQYNQPGLVALRHYQLAILLLLGWLLVSSGLLFRSSQTLKLI
ncbi:MAG: DUF3526 domain-containing protein [Chitinophagaceae bacterium]|nr:DUF3526 domain-containing protein [Chitinophagaceae bacterium]MCW5928903.1 DUF3526 domain-containing protein [Chitinophagaceae bacterium]